MKLSHIAIGAFLALLVIAGFGEAPFGEAPAQTKNPETAPATSAAPKEKTNNIIDSTIFPEGFILNDAGYRVVFQSVKPRVFIQSEDEPLLDQGENPIIFRSGPVVIRKSRDIAGPFQNLSNRRGWSPEQATSAPDTFQAGDIQTAWASLSQNAEQEWLELTYSHEIRPIAVIVYETYNPGALTEVKLLGPNGEQAIAWSGTAAPSSKEMQVRVVPVTEDIETERVRLTLSPKAVPGWNEIDAVGLLDATGKTYWARKAIASSSYADRRAQPVNYGRVVPDSNEVRELREEVEKLKKDVSRLQFLIKDLHKRNQRPARKK